ncbi:MAG: hypothetical protein WCT07_00150 [Candidatus Paceibacterota bacterium]|jgi:hypothetical protein
MDLDYLKYGKISFVLFLICIPLSSVSFVAAQETNTNVQEQCFSTLKENMKETTLFETPLLELEKMSYTDIYSKFGEKKKMLQSFDLTIDQPILGIRLYSFGNQTGYSHPPKSAYPDSYKSETWGDPVKEYVVAEEYVTDLKGNEHFLNCVFLQIASDNLLAVTEDKYAYDGTAISIAKTASNESFKAWYYQSLSFDYDNKPLATWKRLIVYPKATQNAYFDRYDVADAYPANKVQSFAVLNFFNQDLVKANNYNDAMNLAVLKYFVKNEKGETVEIALPTSLRPIVFSGTNTSFSHETYYQSIENKFPEFASLLSIRGALKFVTFKKLLSNENLNPETIKFMNAFADSETNDAFYLNKNNTSQSVSGGNSPIDLSKLLPLIQNADETISKLADGKTTLDSLIAKDNNTLLGNSLSKPMLIVVGTTSLIIFVGFGVYIWRKKQKLINNDKIL